MWIRLSGSKPFALKIYLGGVNGVSGEPMIPNMATYLKRTNSAARKQDYVVVPGQPWLDGIATSPGLVKQFVAMPYGSGYSVEHQVTGTETVGGLQFEIIPCFDKGGLVSREAQFGPTGSLLDVLKTPRELGLRPGETLYFKNKNHIGKRPMVLRDLVSAQPVTTPQTLAIDLYQIFNGTLEISVPKGGTAFVIRVSTIPSSYQGEYARNVQPTCTN